MDGRHEIVFDHHTPEFRDDNQAVVRRLHESGCPMGWSESNDGFWAVYGYDAIYDAVHDTELFSSGHSPDAPKGIPPAGYEQPLVPIDFDGEAVKDYRRVALARLSPTGAKRDEPRIRQLCTELIDEFIERGSADLSQELFTPLPARWILETLGWQPERWREWIEWVHAEVHEAASNPDTAYAAAESIVTNIVAEMQARRDHPSDDLFTEILDARPGGEPLTDDQIIGYSHLLLLGGMDTTAGLTGNVVAYLAQHSELRDRLIAQPDLLPQATEEFLRMLSPSYGLYRRVTRDAEFHGQSLHAGERVMLMFPAAGLDPAAFHDPETADLERTGNRHMAFGLGPHRCLGSHHARVMFQVMLEQVLERLPDYRITGPAQRFPDSGNVYAYEHLPVEFTPGPRRHPSA